MSFVQFSAHSSHNDCRLAPWYNIANCDACFVCIPPLGMSRPDEQRKVCDQMLVLLFLIVSLTGIFRHLICNIVCIYLYIYVCRRINEIRTHTHNTHVDMHPVSVSQSERGNLVFLFRERVYCLHRCVSFTARLVRRSFVVVGHAPLLLSMSETRCRPLTILLAADGQILS